MTESTRESARAPDVLPAKGEVPAQRLDEQGASEQVHKILAGTGDPAQLPRLVSAIPAAKRKTVSLTAVAKVASAEIVFAVAELVAAPAETALTAALGASPAPKPASLRVYLERSTDLGSLSPETFDQVKSLLGGKLIEILPSIVRRIAEIKAHAGFVKWLVDTSPAGVTADLVFNNASPELVHQLDTQDLWDWLATASPLARTTLDPAVLLATSNALARSRLAALLGPLAAAKTGDDASHIHAANKDAVHAALASNGSLAALREAIGNQGFVNGADQEALLARLRVLHASAEDLLEIANLGGFAMAANHLTLAALLEAPDVQPTHVATLLWEHPSAAEGLKQPRLRALVRKQLPGLRLQTLFKADDAVHYMMVSDEGLTQWFFETADPSDLLAFCAATPAVAAKATRLVGARYPDWAWVHALTSAEPIHLRTLALYCPDAKTKQYIHATLLGDTKQGTFIDQGVGPEDTRALGGGELQRFQDLLDAFDPAAIDRLLDLPEAQRLAFGQDAETVRTLGLLYRTEPTRMARAFELVGASFANTIRATPTSLEHASRAAIIPHLRARPATEEAAALGDAALVERASDNISANLLVIFPSLASPATLARALGRIPPLLGWLLTGSDLNLVVDLISRPEVAPVAQQILDASPKLLDLLPDKKLLTARGQQGVDRLAKATPEDSSAAPRMGDIVANEHGGAEGVHAEAKRLHDADRKATLAEGIELLVKRQGSQASALGLLDSHAAQVPELLGDRLQSQAVRDLAALLDLPPNLALPRIDPDHLIGLPNALEWFFHFRDPTVLLHLLGSPQSFAHVAGALSSHARGAQRWLAALPVGAGLTDRESHTLDRLRPLIIDAEGLHELFRVRFGVSAPGELDQRNMVVLFQAVERLPRAHLTHGRVVQIVQRDLQGPDGDWDQTTGSVELSPNVKAGAEAEFHDDEHDLRWLAKDRFLAAFQFTEPMLAQQLAAGRVEMRKGESFDEYRVKPVDLAQLADVVIHEVGHSVDTMLGGKTEIVYGAFANWRVYTGSNFEHWATEMGGWDKVRPADRNTIHDVWVEALASGVAVSQLVGEDHPARSAEYLRAGVGVIKLASDRLTTANRVELGDRVYIAREGTFSSLTAHAALSAPSDYSLTTPAEFFAESYLEYYRGVDGTPAGEHNKGGALPAPVKTWFDTHVDNLKYDPQKLGPDKSKLRPEI